MDFPMFGMEPFITPFATKYEPAAAASALAQNRNAVFGHEDRQAQLAENTREFNIQEPTRQFTAYGNQYTANRQQNEAETEQDTKLLQWIHDTVRSDPAKAQAAAPFLHGVLQSRGIDMQWDPQTGETASPPAAQSGQLAQAQPGESFQDFYGRMVKAAPAGIPKPGSTEADMIARHQREVGAPEAPPEQPKPPPARDVRNAMPPPGTPLSQWMGEVANQPAPQAQEAAPPEEVQQEMRQQGQPYGTGQPPPEPPPQVQQQPPQQGAPPAQAPATRTAPAPPAEGIAASQAAPQAAPKGRWVFSKNGKELGAIDMGSLAEVDRKRSSAEAEGFASSVLPPEDKALVEGMTKRLLESGMTPDQVHEVITKTLEPELHRRSYERASIMASRSRAAAASNGSQDRLGYQAGSETANKWLADSGAIDIQKGLEQIPELRAKLGSGNYNAVIGAAYNFARLNDPKGIVTDKDYEHALGKTLWDKVKDFIYGNDPSEPNLNPEEIARMQSLADVMEGSLKAKRAELIKAAPDRIKRMPTGEMRNGALDAFDSTFRGAPEWDKQRSGGTPEPTAPKASVRVTETERTKHGSLAPKTEKVIGDLEPFAK